MDDAKYITTGIEMLDSIFKGGIPKNRLSVIVGTPRMGRSFRLEQYIRYKQRIIMNDDIKIGKG
jgi:KaiC/GvpD/RAD55 family RecA-like ATPase